MAHRGNTDLVSSDDLRLLTAHFDRRQKECTRGHQLIWLTGPDLIVSAMDMFGWRIDWYYRSKKKGVSGHIKVNERDMTCEEASRPFEGDAVRKLLADFDKLEVAPRASTLYGYKERGQVVALADTSFEFCDKPESGLSSGAFGSMLRLYLAEGAKVPALFKERNPARQAATFNQLLRSGTIEELTRYVARDNGDARVCIENGRRELHLSVFGPPFAARPYVWWDPFANRQIKDKSRRYDMDIYLAEWRHR